ISSFFNLPVSSLRADTAQNETDFLQPEQAFVFTYEQSEQNLHLNWHIADDYYLYKERITVKANGSKIIVNSFPEAEIKQDPYFGEVPVYHHELAFSIPVNNAETFEISYQ